MTRGRWGRKEQGRRERAIDGVNEAEETKVTSTERRKKDMHVLHVLHFIASQLLVHLGLNMHAANTLLICSTFLDCNSLLPTHKPCHTCQRTSVRAVEQENQRSHDIRTACDHHRLRA